MGKDCWVLVSLPKPETNSQYSKIISWVDKESHLPLRIEFFDKKKRHCKSLEVKAIKKIDGIWTVMDMIMKDLLSKHATRMKTIRVEYNRGLSDDLFTKRNLEKY